jgi:starch phosphorylase
MAAAMPIWAGPRGPVAYFSMEIALEDSLPTYSGGLGVLAGDHLRAAADAGLPLVAVTLLYRQGYFEQHLDPDGTQREEPVRFDPAGTLEPLDAEVTVSMAGEPVRVGAWRTVVRGVSGHEVPVYLLDTAGRGNGTDLDELTGRLYGGDDEYRLRQEILLGLGGVAMLERLGHADTRVFHMNEGHSSLLTVALLRRHRRGGVEAVRRQCVFTTHTPVDAGHDRFPAALARRLLGDEALADARSLGGVDSRGLDMTRLGMGASRFVNAVSRRHGEVTRAMFPDVEVHTVTNGVHLASWAAPATAGLFDRHLVDWRHDGSVLRQAAVIPLDEVRAAHDESKQAMLEEVARRHGRRLDPKALTLVFARRATPYKRMGLLFSDLERLRALVHRTGPLQVVLAGKAHPRDLAGKELIRQTVAVSERLGDAVPVVYLPGYSIDLARTLCAGADVWLNTPSKPHEASGTSGMKAAVNGVPSLSVLDGWWVEGHVEGVTGWAVGDESPDGDEEAEVASLYERLEHSVAAVYYGDPDAFTRVRRSTIALNGSYFTTERMVDEYCRLAYTVD